MPVFFSPEELDAFGEEMEERAAPASRSEYLPRVRPFPTVRELFQRLDADGKRIVLASSAKEDEMEQYKEIAGIADLIEGETSSDDAERRSRTRTSSRPRWEARGRRPGRGDRGRRHPLRRRGRGQGGPAHRRRALRRLPRRRPARAGCVALYRDPADLLANYCTPPLA